MKLFCVSSQDSQDCIIDNFFFLFGTFLRGRSRNPGTSKMELFVTSVNGFQFSAVNYCQKKYRND